MRRRDFVSGLLLAAAGWQVRAEAPAKTYHLAIVDPLVPMNQINSSHPVYATYFDQLNKLGYVEGGNLAVERFSGEGRAEHYPELARTVVQHNPDVIYAIGYRLLLDLKELTKTIPIVGMTGD